MNNKIYILFFLCLAFLLASCDGFLSVDIRGKTTTPNLFKDIDGVRSARIGAYQTMYAYYSSDFYSYAEVLGDNLYVRNQASSTVKDLSNFIYDEDNLMSYGGIIWRYIYEALANINYILVYQPELLKKYPMHTDELMKIKGEMLFNRALCHFDLSRVFGQAYNYTADASHLGIPVMLKAPSPTYKPTRNTMKEVYEAILSDLDEAELLFQNVDNKDPYYVSLAAIQALKARVYLYKEDWEQAERLASLAMSDKSLSTGEEYVSMFQVFDVKGKEVIFRLSSGVSRDRKLIDFFSHDEAASVSLSDAYIKLYKDAENLEEDTFEKAEDIRARRLIKLVKLEGKENQYLPLCGKYDLRKAGEEPLKDEEERYNPIVFRLSELYLIRAEAYLQQNKLELAQADIKKLLARAYDKSIDEIELPLTKEELFEVLKEERRKELAFEGHRFYDLMRWNEGVYRDDNTSSSVQYIDYPNVKFVQPIPLKELENNSLLIGNPEVNSKNTQTSK